MANEVSSNPTAKTGFMNFSDLGPLPPGTPGNFRRRGLLRDFERRSDSGWPPHIVSLKEFARRSGIRMAWNRDAGMRLAFPATEAGHGAAASPAISLAQAIHARTLFAARYL